MDIMFIDQTQAVILKTQTNEDQETRIITQPSLDADTGVVDFFINNFACDNSRIGTNLFWVPSNMRELLENESTRLSTQSVGAMALARLHRSANYFREAQRKYGEALLSLAALWRHKDIEKNSILITVLFLGFFEILASYATTSRQSWTAHLKGIGALLDMRDQSFFSTDFGARVLLQSRNQAILNALQTKKRVPEAYRRPSHRFKQPMPPNIMVSHNAEILLIRLADLQEWSEVSGHSLAFLDDLDALDQDLIAWSSSLPPPWSFAKQPYDDSATGWWDTRRDVYPTAIVTHVWNKVRAARLVVHTLRCETFLQLSSSSSDSSSCSSTRASVSGGHAESLRPEIRTLVIDICATIPVFYRPSSRASQNQFQRPVLGATYWLLWPLEVVGSMRDGPSELTTWTVRCLERIHETTGIMKAQVAADRIKNSSNNVAVAG